MKKDLSDLVNYHRDSDFEPKVKSYKNGPKKGIYIVKLINSETDKVLWSGEIEARGPKQARNFWRVKHNDIREKYIGLVPTHIQVKFDRR